MKKAIILHRWSGTPESDWYSWLADELRACGYEVTVPLAPNTDHPKIEERMEFMDGVMEDADEETVFICHSIGCQTLMRWLASHDKKIGDVIFVAGWVHLLNLEDEEVGSIAKPWLDTPIDFEHVRDSMKSLSVFLSDNEPYGCVEENREIFEKKLGAKVTVLASKGHFTEDDSVVQVPEILALF
jgi:predicted alpha/beta hydrolase family esterase